MRAQPQQQGGEENQGERAAVRGRGIVPARAVQERRGQHRDRVRILTTHIPALINVLNLIRPKT